MSSTPTDSLSVIIQGIPTGELRYGRDPVFSYDPSYDGPDLSVSMRMRDGLNFTGINVTNWIEGLLPDSPVVRESMAASCGCKPTDQLALLERFGLDLPGGVQFCRSDEVELVIGRAGALQPISKTEIAARLSAMVDVSSGSDWQAEGEHWSLAGSQSKIALRLGDDGSWYSCLGAAATTHIIKPGVMRYRSQALDEYVCMRTAELAGVDAARTSYETFDGIPAIVIERFDRKIDDFGEVVRLHQEDLCQALGIHPSRKYTSDGGPKAKDIVLLLKEKTSPESVDSFVSMLFFNYLIGATDAHAKNYAFLLGKSTCELAPAFDMASILPYDKRYGGSAWRCAMSIGGENRVGYLRGSCVDKFSAECNLSAPSCRDVMAELAETIPDCMERAFAEVEGREGVAQLRARLLPAVRVNCRLALTNLDKDFRGMASPGALYSLRKDLER